jgi:hypothetical protein
MKAKLICMMLLIVAATSVTIFSCKKQDAVAKEESTAIDNTTMQVAKDWLNSQKNKATGKDKQNIDSIITKADWINASIQSIDKQEALIFIPLVTKNNNLGIALSLNKKTLNIDSGSLFLINNKLASSNMQPSNLILQLRTKNSFKFTGSITTYSISNKFQYEYGYANGIWKYTKQIKSKLGGTSADGTVKVNDQCTYWYWVTYYDDGTEDWDFWFKICSGSDCNQTGVVHLSDGQQEIKTFCGGNNTGGGSSGDQVTQEIILKDIDCEACKVVLLHHSNGDADEESSPYDCEASSAILEQYNSFTDHTSSGIDPSFKAGDTHGSPVMDCPIAISGIKATFVWDKSNNTINVSQYSAYLYGFSPCISLAVQNGSPSTTTSNIISFTINSSLTYSLLHPQVLPLLTKSVKITGTFNTNNGAYTMNVHSY